MSEREVLVQIIGTRTDTVSYGLKPGGVEAADSEIQSAVLEFRRIHPNHRVVACETYGLTETNEHTIMRQEDLVAFCEVCSRAIFSDDEEHVVGEDATFCKACAAAAAGWTPDNQTVE